MLQPSALAGRRAVVVLCLAVVACGGNGDDDDPPPPGTFRVSVVLTDPSLLATRGGTLFKVVDADGRTVAVAGVPSSWNSYCASGPTDLHFFVQPVEEAPYEVRRLPKPDASLRTSYAFPAADGVYVDDLANDRQFRLAVNEGAAQFQAVSSQARLGCAEYRVGAVTYRWAPGEIRACTRHDQQEQCDAIPIRAETFPYAYGEAGGNTVVVTNWGEVLMHRRRGWCRASPQGEAFRCVEGEPGPQLEAPRGFQFYSSIKYRGHTLLGRWPGGELYRFDGQTLSRWNESPTLPPGPLTDVSEAQSMSLYCGDLHVGYWPRGDRWVKAYGTGAWMHQGRAFTHPLADAPAIPYLGAEPEGAEWAFFGQRITSMAPFGDSLYLATSNLRNWSKGVHLPSYLAPEQVDEYGSILALRRGGCASGQARYQDYAPVHFDISADKIRIRQHGVTLGEAAHRLGSSARTWRIVRTTEVFGEPMEVHVLAARAY
ncbi:MAG: hypothetical protein JNL30_11110 [Rubrivivax sp.]|nr:hypothetical protein [Rubrivivax sp.]